MVNNLDSQRLSSVKCGIRFFFSTERNLKKFETMCEKRVLWLNDSLSRRFHMAVLADELALFQLYMMCEGRGFRVVDERNGMMVCSPENLCFNVQVEIRHDDGR